MTDAVSKVDEIAQTGLALVDGDNVRLDSDGTGDDRQEQLLGGRTCGLTTARKVGGRCLNGGEYLGRARLQGREFVLVPDGRSLWVRGIVSTPVSQRPMSLLHGRPHTRSRSPTETRRVCEDRT